MQPSFYCVFCVSAPGTGAGAAGAASCVFAAGALGSERVRESSASSAEPFRSDEDDEEDDERSLPEELFVSLSVFSRLVELFEEPALPPERSRVFTRPIDVSLSGTSVAPAGIEFSYSWLSRSIAARMEALRSMSSVPATVWRSFRMSGIQ